MILSANDLIQKAMNLVAAKGRQDYRKICKEIHLRQFDSGERSLVKSLSGFINTQIRFSATRLEELSGKKSAEDQASVLIRQIFNPSEWDDRLYQIVAPSLVRMMLKASASEFEMIRRGSKVFGCKASTATEWLEQSDDYDLIPVPFQTPTGTVYVRIATEYPQWMVEEIQNQLTESFAQSYWANVNLTTSGDIEQFIRSGLVDGKSIREIAKEIIPNLVQTGRYAKSRATNIARTETTTALNAARTAAIDGVLAEADVPAKREWLSVLGNTTRLEHANLDGVPANRKGMWNLAGYEVRWPGDINLPPEHRCNCQCTVAVAWGLEDQEADAIIEDYESRVSRYEELVNAESGNG